MSGHLVGVFRRGTHELDALVTVDMLKDRELKARSLAGQILTGADLTDKDCTEADFVDCTLSGVSLRRAILRGADLSGVKGLLEPELSGADLAGAKLSRDEFKFDGLGYVQELAKGAATLLISILTACLYSLVTIGATKDVDLVTNAGTLELPLLSTKIPVISFYLMAPIVLFAAYAYFHLYLQRFWESVSELPAVFPDGRGVDEKVYTWLLNSRIRLTLPRLSPDKPAFVRQQNAIALAVGWWTVPVTLAGFWLVYLRRHDAWGTSLQTLLLILSMGGALSFSSIATNTLAGGTRRWDLSWPKTGGILLAAFLLVAFSGCVICGFLRETGPLGWLKSHHLYDPDLVLTNSELSSKPKNWPTDGDHPSLGALKGVNPARLQGANLIYSELQGAFLVKCQAPEARFDHADMTDIRLDAAKLHHASLVSARLDVAHLKNADLSAADLRGARLRNADLTGVNLKGSLLKGADLTDTILQGSFYDKDTVWPHPSYEPEKHGSQLVR